MTRIVLDRLILCSALARAQDYAGQQVESDLRAWTHAQLSVYELTVDGLFSTLYKKVEHRVNR